MMGCQYMMIGVLLCVVLLSVYSSAFPQGQHYPESDFYDNTDEVMSQDILTEAEKRSGGGLRPIPFPCNGYDNMPRCLNGGKGPRKTWTKSGRFCVCLCPSKWVGPECGYAASTAKRFPWGMKPISYGDGE